MRHLRSFAFAALALSALTTTACRKKPVVAPPPAVVAKPFNQDSANAAEAAKRAAAEAAARAAAEKAAKDAADRAAAAAAVAAARAAFATPVYFDYDKSDIREDQKGTLEAKLPVFQANPDMRIRVAGHTDNRGSDEYNLALGQRRAAEVKRYLISRGIDAGRIDVVSFGEERPAVQGDNEEAWAKNRRDEFEIIAGADPFKLPNK